MKDKRLEILNVLKQNMIDGYEFEEIDFLSEFEIGINKLFEEVEEVYRASSGLMISDKKINILDRTRKNSIEYDVIKLVYKTAKKELTSIIIGKEQVIVSLIMMFIQSNLPEVKEVYGFSSEEIRALNDIEIYEILKSSFEYIVELQNEVEDINPFYDMAYKITDLLEQVL